MEGQQSKEGTITTTTTTITPTTSTTQSSSGDTSTKKTVSWASIIAKKVDTNNNNTNTSNTNNTNTSNNNNNNYNNNSTTQTPEKPKSQPQPSSPSSSSLQKEPKVKNLVVDANVFIKRVRLESYGDIIWTIPEVLEEVRDKTSRDFITFLPYEIKTKSPTPLSTQAVLEFSKKTGDFPALSATDLKLIALVHTLELEVHGNVDHLRTTPPERKMKPLKEERERQRNAKKQAEEEQKSQEENTESSSLKTTEVASIDSKKKEGEEEDLTLRDENEIEVIVQSEDVHDEDSDEDEDESDGDGDGKQKESEKDGDNNSEIAHDKVEPVESSLSKLSISKSRKGKKEQPQDDDDEAGYEPWITPDNISQMKQQHDSNTTTTQIKKEIRVGCLTADFAMQNVMLSMGMKIISVDGLLIKKTKQFVLRCVGCFTVCTDMEKAFCPACGNSTLARVAKIVDWSGAIIYTNFSSKTLSKRGTKYSIPTYKGGRHAHNIILNEEAYLKAVQSRPPPKSVNLLDPDADAALGVKRQAKPVVVGYGRRNPNISKKRFGKKNKPVVNR